ncbi:MAG: SAM-dependent methyltransferase, partial [Proteobacteria bacterium]|nr:SAM-dependent methyltransferase [Pseudomonadota bacterium]
MIFRLESLATIVAYITQADPIAFAVLDPDRGAGRYAGELVDGHVHRPWRVWIELADRLGLRMRTPHVAGALVELAFDRLDPTATWQVDPALPASEKYGVASGFGRIAKLEDPGFLIDLREAIER